MASPDPDPYHFIQDQKKFQKTISCSFKKAKKGDLQLQPNCNRFFQWPHKWRGRIRLISPLNQELRLTVSRIRKKYLRIRNTGKNAENLQINADITGPKKRRPLKDSIALQTLSVHYSIYLRAILYIQQGRGG